MNWFGHWRKDTPLPPMPAVAPPAPEPVDIVDRLRRPVLGVFDATLGDDGVIYHPVMLDAADDIVRLRAASILCDIPLWHVAFADDDAGRFLSEYDVAKAFAERQAASTRQYATLTKVVLPSCDPARIALALNHDPHALDWDVEGATTIYPPIK